MIGLYSDKSVAARGTGSDDGRVTKPKTPRTVSVAVAVRAARQQTGFGVPAVRIQLS
jgi:hypothetical protein